ncbi:MAG: KTSC domain-containing protein [Candidatus Kapaibacterium sp.]
MKLMTVRSNAIHAIGYDSERLLLEVVFKAGGIYRYAHVPPQVVRKFLASPSKGQFFQNHIRGYYSMYRISRPKIGRRKRSRGGEEHPMEQVH